MAPGEPLRVNLDPAEFSGRIRIMPPGNEESVTRRAVADDKGTELVAVYEDTGRSGIYRVEADRHEGRPRTTLFAANIEAEEGDLRTADEQAVRGLIDAENVAFFDGGARRATEGPDGGRSELWRALLAMLALTLCVEQGLGWWFGKKRER